MTYYNFVSWFNGRKEFEALLLRMYEPVKDHFSSRGCLKPVRIFCAIITFTSNQIHTTIILLQNDHDSTLHQPLVQVQNQFLEILNSIQDLKTKVEELRRERQPTPSSSYQSHNSGLPKEQKTLAAVSTIVFSLSCRSLCCMVYFIVS